MGTDNVTVYKVVRKDANGRYASWGVTGDDGFWRVFYDIGAKALPLLKDSYLYAFASCDDAERFLSTNTDADTLPDCAILQCKASVVGTTPYMCVIQGGIKSFWRKYKKCGGCPYGYGIHAPQGTLWCTSITPQVVVG
jgi:hypothetical protein